MKLTEIVPVLLVLILVLGWIVLRRRMHINRERRRKAHNDNIRRDWDIMQKTHRDEAEKR